MTGPRSRRDFLAEAARSSAALLATAPLVRAQAPLPSLDRPTGAPEVVARDEAYWARVAAYYPVSREFTNLEAGFWGVTPEPVKRVYATHLERVNRENSYYARREYPADLERVRSRVAAAVGADVSEIALTRNATEANQALISGYNRLRRGDAVIYADVDYPAMQYAMNWLADRRGVRVARIAIPEPATRDNVLAVYEDALRANPEARLLLLTHLNNKSGLILPVAEIRRLAADRGVDVIVDAAHSWGQREVTVGSIGADFIGFNLHKWMGAPLGVGAAYVRRSRLPDVDRMMADEDNPADSVLSRVHTGTMNFAAVMSVPAALDFHDAIGPACKAARLRYLRDRWVHAVRNIRGIDILTPDDPDMAGAITSFRLRGGTTKEHNDAVVQTLVDRYRIFTVRRSGLQRGDCVRVTPALYNAPADVDRLADALKALAAG